MNRCGFWFQCFRKFRAVDFVLTNVRRHFPDSPILLASDGGLDFTALATTYKCDYTHYQENIWGGGSDRPVHYDSYFSRLSRMFDYPVDWVVILEDDVYCRKSIEYWPSVEAAGPIGNEWSQNFKALVLQKNAGKPVSRFLRYGNCGGSIFKMEAMRDAYSRMTPELMAKAHAADERFGRWPDASITGTIQLAGYAYEKWLEHSEESVGVFSPVGVGAFDHQHKVHYGKT